MSAPIPAVDESEVKTMLEARRGDWIAIAKSADVSHSWLSKFVNGHIDNPGINTLRRVRAAIAGLNGAPLAAARATLHLKPKKRDQHSPTDRPGTDR